MKSWWRFWGVVLLVVILSLRLSQSLTAEVMPAQLVEQAQIYYQQDKFIRSIQLLERARSLYQKQDKPLQQAQILTLISLAQQELEAWDLAQDNLTKSWSLIKEIAPSPQKTRVLAQIRHSQGNWEFNRGKNRLALEYWQRAEEKYRKIDDRLGIANSLLDRAKVLHKMGFYDRSCELGFAVLEFSNLDCDRLNPEQIKAAIALIKNSPQPWQQEALYLIAKNLIQNQKFTQAETLIRANQDLNSQQVSSQAKILSNLAELHRGIAFKAKQNGDLASFTRQAGTASQYYRQLEAMLVREKPDSQDISFVRLNLLALLVATQKWSQAEAVAVTIPTPSFLASNTKENLYARIKFAQNLATLKENKFAPQYSWREITEFYLQGIAEAENIGGRRLQSYAWGNLAILQIEHSLSLEHTPEQALEIALNLAQRINTPELAYRWQWQLGKIYNQRGERTKAIDSYQAAVASLKSLRKNVAALAKDIQYDFYEKIEPVYKQYTELLLRPEHPSAAELTLALDAIESLQIAELDNYFQDPCVIFRVRTIDAIDDRAAAIYTSVLPDRLEVIMAIADPNSPNSQQILRHHTEYISQAELEKTIEQLRQYITEPDRTREVQKLSARLYDWLIRPFSDDLTVYQPKNLVFVLDTLMQTIPMSVLYDGEQYLLEKYPIALTPGLRTLNLEPKGESSNYLVGGITQPLKVREYQFSALPNVTSELNIFQDSKDVVLIDEKFTAKNLLDRLNKESTSRIHIATHGQFDSNPDKTFLLLWGKLLNIKEFSKILLSRQTTIKFPLDLLVLSACDTAVGDNRAALGLAGIAVRSSALTTLATLWQVNDESTAILMNKFHQYLKNNHTKADALRRAQLDLWKVADKDWKVPAFWSAYVTIGNWN